MNSVTKDVTIGFNNEIGMYTVYAKQYDTNRKIHFELIDELSSYAVEDTTHIFFREKFSNGTILPPVELDKSGLSDDGTELTMTLTKNMLSISGVAQCEIVFVKSESTPTFNKDGTVETDDSIVLSTQNFNIYIEEIVYKGGCFSGSDDLAFSQLIPVLLAVQGIAERDETYTANEAVRVENEFVRTNNEADRMLAENAREENEDTRINSEDTRIQNENQRIFAENIRIDKENQRTVNETERIKNEAERIENENQRKTDEDERIRLEKERIAREGAGDYASHEDFSYKDEQGNTHTVLYQDSRVGTQERVRALVDGGSFIDETGNRQEIKNEYINKDGELIRPDVSTFENLSMLVLASMMKEMHDDDTFTKLAESYAHGGVGVREGEDTDNAKFYSDRAAENYVESKNIMDKVQAILDALNDSIQMNVPDVQIDMADGHLRWQGGKFTFVLDQTTGKLAWDV